MATHVLKTNTATRITVGPFFDKTDGVTPETGLTVTSCKLTMTVDTGGVPTLILDTNPTASGGSNDMVHITGDDAGMYDLELTASNLNYVGNAKIVITDAATHCPVVETIEILPAHVYDSRFNTVGAAHSLGIVDQGTAQSATASTIVLRSAAAFADDEVIGMVVLTTGGTGVGQARIITDYVSSTDTATVSPDWTTTPSGTIEYKVLASPPAATATSALPGVDVKAWLGTAAATPTVAGVPEVDLTHWLGTAAATPTVAGVPEVDVTHMGGTAGTFAAGIPEVKVASMAAGSVTAAAIATGAIDADALATDAVTEMVNGFLTTQMTESYAADGVAPTVAQAFFAMQQFMQEKSISGTTMTIKKLDGSTTAMTLTLDSATVPTSITRAT